MQGLNDVMHNVPFLTPSSAKGQHKYLPWALFWNSLLATCGFLRPCLFKVITVTKVPSPASHCSLDYKTPFHVSGAAKKPTDIETMSNVLLLQSVHWLPAGCFLNNGSSPKNLVLFCGRTPDALGDPSLTLFGKLQFTLGALLKFPDEDIRFQTRHPRLY